MTGEQDTSPSRTVLFVSSNGAGMGHLTRLMALARRASEHVRPIFLTLSTALPVVRHAGYLVEYVPQRDVAGMSYGDWHTLLRERMSEIISTHGVEAVVFDGTHVYEGLLDARRDHPDLPFTWSRRALWKPESPEWNLEASDAFDLVIEPGDLAEEFDRGPTVPLRHQAHRVGPVLLLDEDELLPRPEARTELGLDVDGTAALVQLGAGNINDISTTVGLVVQRLRGVDGLQICLAQASIADDAVTEAGVKRVSVHPLARYLRAFDIAVAAAGYNTFHELLTYAVPTILVPNLETATDDQHARARFAERAGAALALPEPNPRSFADQLQRILDPDVREQMRERARAVAQPNGARAAMSLIEERLRPQRRETAETPPTASGTARDATAPGRRSPPARGIVGRVWRWLLGLAGRLVKSADERYRHLPRPVKRVVLPLVRPVARRLRPARTAPTVMIVLGDRSGEDRDEILEVVTSRTSGPGRLHPVIVTSVDDLAPLRRRGLTFEYVVPEGDWPSDPAGPWEQHLGRRLATIVRAHRVDHILHLSADTSTALALDLLEALVPSGA
jgi:UDP:flavonoid glycosyltransferase YjiC (YdhE family)